VPHAARGTRVRDPAIESVVRALLHRKTGNVCSGSVLTINQEKILSKRKTYYRANCLVEKILVLKSMVSLEKGIFVSLAQKYKNASSCGLVTGKLYTYSSDFTEA